MARTIHITRYGEFPDIPLLLDQVLLLANQALAALPHSATAPHAGTQEGDNPEPVLTASMVNNYVKRKLVPAPVKKRYGKDQVCLLVWTCLLKQVMDLKDIDAFFGTVMQGDGLERAYDGFCADVEALLGAGAAPELPLDELTLAAAQAVAARIRLLALIDVTRPPAQDDTPAKPTKQAKPAKSAKPAKPETRAKQHARTDTAKEAR